MTYTDVAVFDGALATDTVGTRWCTRQAVVSDGKTSGICAIVELYVLEFLTNRLGRTQCALLPASAEKKIFVPWHGFVCLA